MIEIVTQMENCEKVILAVGVFIGILIGCIIGDYL